MGCASNVRRARRKAAWAPAMIGILPIPDPRTWPTGARERFREITGVCGPLDVFIFTSGPTAAMYLQDAVTALGILGVGPAEWRTDEGYPVFQFRADRAVEYSQILTACGYTVRVVELTQRCERNSGGAKRAEVIDIASARRGRTNA